MSDISTPQPVCEILVVSHAPGEPWRLAELEEHVAAAAAVSDDGAAETG